MELCLIFNVLNTFLFKLRNTILILSFYFKISDFLFLFLIFVKMQTNRKEIKIHQN